MSRKIIGITVGSTLPKPNLMQSDPSKGDYVKGKEAIPTKASQLENDSKYLQESQLPDAINQALAQAKESGEFDGYTPVKGQDYYTEEDEAEMEAAVLAHFSHPSRMTVVKSGSTINISAPMADGSLSLSSITLDANGYPTKVNTDGVECPITWEGFE